MFTTLGPGNKTPTSQVYWVVASNKSINRSVLACGSRQTCESPGPFADLICDVMCVWCYLHKVNKLPRARALSHEGVQLLIVLPLLLSCSSQAFVCFSRTLQFARVLTVCSSRVHCTSYIQANKVDEAPNNPM